MRAYSCDLQTLSNTILGKGLIWGLRSLALSITVKSRTELLTLALNLIQIQCSGCACFLT